MSTRHSTFVEIDGQRYRVELDHGVIRVSGGVLFDTVELDHLADLVLVGDAAAERLREETSDRARRDGGAQ